MDLEVLDNSFCNKCSTSLYRLISLILLILRNLETAAWTGSFPCYEYPQILCFYHTLYTLFRHSLDTPFLQLTLPTSSVMDHAEAEQTLHLLVWAAAESGWGWIGRGGVTVTGMCWVWWQMPPHSELPLHGSSSAGPGSSNLDRVGGFWQ